MKKIVLSAEEIRGEVQKRLLMKPYVSGDWSALSVPLPARHAPDAESRNWDMKDIPLRGNVRLVVEQARREILLFDGDALSDMTHDA
jgi:hypothetical protein